jgi:hypothetical protein
MLFSFVAVTLEADFTVHVEQGKLKHDYGTVHTTYIYIHTVGLPFIPKNNFQVCPQIFDIFV